MKFLILAFFIFSMITFKTSISFSKTYSLQDVAATLESTYKQPFKNNHNLELKINLNQEEPLYFGGANLNNGVFEINVGADILTLPAMTTDAATLILCHELGHLLSGGAKKPNSTWASTEGQSDYFAATDCAPKIFSQMADSPTTPMSARIIAAGQALIEAIYIFMDVPQMPRPSISRREALTEPGTSVNYPTLQCRLDTFVDGAKGIAAPLCW
ncbi:MAG: hypothetical protein H7256_07240 [Bdellovibrio sp.]|nr:hypothetical protein [Bdellovibrio sp.]